MTPGNPKPESEDTLVTGASEADAKQPVDFEPNEAAGSGKTPAKAGEDEPDAGDLTDARRRDGGQDAKNAAPGAVSPNELTTESDDGAG